MAIDRPLVEIGAGSSALAEPDPEPDPAEPPAPIEQRIAALERSVELTAGPPGRSRRAGRLG